MSVIKAGVLLSHQRETRTATLPASSFSGSEMRKGGGGESGAQLQAMRSDLQGKCKISKMQRDGAFEHSINLINHK